MPAPKVESAPSAGWFEPAFARALELSKLPDKLSDEDKAFLAALKEQRDDGDKKLTAEMCQRVRNIVG